MLLTSIALRRRGDESGSALIGVLALMMVTAVIGVTIVTATVHGLSVTSSSRASVQSRAAAEAGIDVAVVGLQTPSSCATAGAVYESTTAPVFRAAIEYESGGTWLPGCPPPTATQVRIESTGSAATPGVAGATAGNRSVLQAIYNYIPDYVEIPHIDAAVYAHTMTGSLKNFDLDSADNNLSADLQIKSGNVNCINGARIAGDVILADGSATLKNCDVTGSIHVSGFANMDGGSQVFGDVIAVGNGVAASADVVTVRGGSITDGDIYSGGNASVLSGSASTAKGNVTVAGTPANKATVASGSQILGNVLSSGTITADGSIAGTRTPAVEGLQPPPVPLIPNWTDMAYPSTTWAAEGYEEVLWTGDCTVGGEHPMWATLSARTTPTVVNALGCTAGGITIDSNVTALTLQTNIAFIAPKFHINKLKLLSLDNRNLWFIQPDNSADGVPTCPTPTAGGITLTNESDIPSTVSVMVYSPCKIYSNRDGFRGQIYGGEVEFGQQAKLTFSPVGIPGVDLSGGVPATVVLDGGRLGNRVSVRELGSGG
jgi:Tfp pilus assembly protein PilX